MKFIFFVLLSASLFASNSSIQSLYSTLDPHSLSQHMAFYELYPETEEGKKALTHAWRLLRQGNRSENLPQFLLPKFDIQAVVSLVTRQPFDPPVKLSGDQLHAISTLCEHFANRKLKGSTVWSREEVLATAPEEIDLCRGLLIEQFENSEDFQNDILQYEASLDLMALQIIAHLPTNATNLEKIREINRYIFQEMQFRFPPHSLYAKDIDLYTFLPSVLDSRQGVCLGVSILYLCLAQRLDLPMEIITPPGHIYVRLREGETITNIETTARGVNTPCETYLGVNTRNLPKRNLREVLGMVFYNHASLAWDTHDFKQAVNLYENALIYMPDDLQLKMLLGLAYILSGKKREGKALLKSENPFLFDEAVSQETIPDDYLKGKTSLKGLKAIFSHVDNTRESILKKQKKLKKILKGSPNFREGWFHLATTYLQLGRESEAFDILKKTYTLNPNNVVVAYYLSILALQRMHFNDAWTYLKQAEKLTAARDHHPKALQSLRQHLKRLCPDPAA